MKRRRKRQRRVLVAPHAPAEAGAAALVGGQVLANVHTPNQCRAEHCTIHNPSDHHMRDWPQNWRSDRRLMERICPHGVGHPDPDDPSWDKTHGCDACCWTPVSFPVLTARCCQDWPVSPLAKIGRCGYCGEVPEMVR